MQRQLKSQQNRPKKVTTFLKSNVHNHHSGGSVHKSAGAPLNEGELYRLSGSPEFLPSKRGIKLRDTRFIQTLTGRNTFAANGNIPLRVELNPGLGETFPWLSKVAENFVSYRITKFSVHVTGLKSAMTSGSLCISYISNPALATSLSKLELLNGGSACEFPVWQGGTYQFDLDPLPNQHLLLRTAPTTDLELYDFGFLQLAFSGLENTIDSDICDLFMSYTVELFQPVMPQETLFLAPHSISQFGNSTQKTVLDGEHAVFDSILHNALGIVLEQDADGTKFRVETPGTYHIKGDFTLRDTNPTSQSTVISLQKNGVDYSKFGQTANVRDNGVNGGYVPSFGRGSTAWRVIDALAGDIFSWKGTTPATSWTTAANSISTVFKYLAPLAFVLSQQLQAERVERIEKERESETIELEKSESSQKLDPNQLPLIRYPLEASPEAPRGSSRDNHLSFQMVDLSKRELPRRL